MRSNNVLQGETVLFTGTLKSDEVFDFVKSYGGRPISLPLIQVEEVVDVLDSEYLLSCKTVDWLIFTSQNAVKFFQCKMERQGLKATEINAQIAAVGTKTAAALEKIGFTVAFIPTVFSADVFVRQFNPTTNRSLRILFVRGSIAGPTIREQLPFQVEEWTVYETMPNLASRNEMIQQLKENARSTVLFASPSAVAVFTQEIQPKVGWKGYTIGAIGHVTEQALLDVGAPVPIRPNTYTLKALVEKLVEVKGCF